MRIFKARYCLLFVLAFIAYELQSTRCFKQEYIQASRTFSSLSLKKITPRHLNDPYYSLTRLRMACIILAMAATAYYYLRHTNTLWYQSCIPRTLLHTLRGYHAIAACIPLYLGCGLVYGAFKLVLSITNYKKSRQTL